MQRQDLFLGLDLGTSSLKALVMDAQGTVQATASAPYPLHTPAPGWAEQDPDDWWSALRVALEGVRDQGVQVGHIAAIGLSGQMHGLVLMDEQGQSLMPCQTWADSRCEAQARAIEPRFLRGRFAAITGSRPNTSATAAKLLWVRQWQPGVWRAATSVLLPKDYLRFRLTGVMATDVSDASGTLLCDVAARVWSDEVLETLRIDHRLLPPIVESPAIIGHVTAAAAAALDLPPGIPVVAGAGDAECAAVGMGLVGEPSDAGVALISIGTAAQVFVVTDTPLTVAATGLQTLCHAVPGRWHVMAGLLSGSSTLDWLASALAAPGAVPASPTGLLDEAAAEPPGARGLQFLPHLRGTRMPVPDPAVRGAFVGLRPEHSRATLTRAVLEGVALALAEALQTMRMAGIAVSEVRLAGGARRHMLWSRVLADAIGLPVWLGATEDASAFGAALLAALGMGALPSSVAIGRLARPHGPAVLPDAPAHALYRDLARVASQATKRLRPTFRSLGTLS